MQTAKQKFNLRTLSLRAVTGVAMVAACLWLTAQGGYLFTGALGLLSLAMIFEWTRLVEKRSLSASFFILSAVSAIAIASAGSGHFAYATGMLTIATFGFGALSIVGHRAGGWLAMVPVYLLLPCVAIIWIRMSWVQGFELTILVFGIVWMTDIGAYFAGKLFGGARLAPRISPAKTWAGLLGGLSLGAVTAVIVSVVFFTALTPYNAAIVGTVLSIATIAGDLLESGLKRNFGVKDASGFIPGHGGVLDRVDGMIIAVLVMVLWLLVLRCFLNIDVF